MSERSEFGRRAASADKSPGTIWTAEWRPRKARVEHMDVPSPECRAPMRLHRIGARPGASGFGYFCRNKSNPLKAEAFDYGQPAKRVSASD